MIIANGFDEAILGVARSCAQPDRVVYDFEKAVRILVHRDGMSEEEAVEFIEFNCVGAYVGEETPLWLNRYSIEDIREME